MDILALHKKILWKEVDETQLSANIAGASNQTPDWTNLPKDGLFSVFKVYPVSSPQAHFTILILCCNSIS